MSVKVINHMGIKTFLGKQEGTEGTNIDISYFSV